MSKEKFEKLVASLEDLANPSVATARKRQAEIQLGRVVFATCGGVQLAQKVAESGGLPAGAASGAVITIVGPAIVETVYNKIVRGALEGMPQDVIDEVIKS